MAHNTEFVAVTWPRKGGKVHRIDVPEYEGKVGTACGREVNVRSSAFGGEPPYEAIEETHDAFLADPDTCQSCAAVARAGR